MQVASDQMAMVFPLVKHPFVVGFLVAELPKMEADGSKGSDLVCNLSPEEAYASESDSFWGIKSFDNERMIMYRLTAEQRSNAINICRSLAMAYVMDQVLKMEHG